VSKEEEEEEDLLIMKQLLTREIHTQNIACQKGGKKLN
jgi:hypothetical protein